MRVYIVKKEFVCMLEGQVCDFVVRPKCRDCDTYQDYKKSGLTIEKYLRKNERQNY